MSGLSILISGASIAGPTLAGWLADAGWEVTVVERAGELRREGQNIDVRGTGRQVLRRMGLEDAVRAAHTGETGTDFVDEHGRPFASFAAGTDDTGGATAELEILRGQLSRILYDRSAPQVDYVFGDQIAALADDGTAVDVEFAHGPARRFDLVVVAEGLRSRTRALIMPDARVRELDLIGAYATIPRTAADNDRWRVFSPGGGRSVALRPDNLGNTQVFLAALSNVRGITRIPRSEFVTVLRATFADVGWEVPRILAELDNDSLYYDELGQMKLPTWSRGRVALLGDAAHAAPVSGMSTALSITGAYVLAGELTTGGADHRAAFARYEQIMRPLVAGAQKFHPGSVELRLVNPRGRVERAVQRAVLRTVASPAIRKLTTLDGPWSRPAADAITLPDYPMTAAAAV